VLAPLGMFGWPFDGERWTAPDHETTDVASLARPEHFAGAAALGFELWSHTEAFATIARQAGAEITLLGRGVPERLPEPRPAGEREIDVLMLERSHWPRASLRLAEALAEAGLDVTRLPVSPRSTVLAALDRARVFVHFAPVEANSRIAGEARAMGAVPVVLDASPFAEPMNEEHGVLVVGSVEKIPAAARALLADRGRLEALSERGIRTAREEMEWEPYVERVAEALSRPPPTDPGHAPRAALGAALRADEGAGPEHVLAATRAELARHRAWLEATNSSLSWRLTKPLRAAKLRLKGDADRST
jgi:hypothetical protein